LLLGDNSALSARPPDQDGTVYRPKAVASGSSPLTDESSAPAGGSPVSVFEAREAARAPQSTLFCPEFSLFRAYHQEDAYDVLFEMVSLKAR
jgi:hypothetical protein